MTAGIAFIRQSESRAFHLINTVNTVSFIHKMKSDPITFAHWRTPVLCIAAVSALYTALVLGFSSRVGRLAHEATYDDCLILFDGLWRLDLMDREGFWAALGSFLNVFPHSPWNTVQCFLAFQIFGVRDISPYWLHIFPLALFLSAVYLALRGFPTWLRCLGVLAAVSFQLSYIIVYELRADPAYAVLITAGLVWAILGTVHRDKISPTIVAAAYGALALSFYIKPTFFLNSLFIAIVFGATLILYNLVKTQTGQSTEDKEEDASWLSRLWVSAKPLVPAAITFAVIAAPLFILHFDYFYDYLIRNAFGSETNIWKIEGGPLEAFRFFTVGWGGMQMMGGTLYSAVVLLLVGTILLAVYRSRTDVVAVGWMALMTFAGLFVMLVGQLNTPFFGLTFHFLFVTTAFLTFARGILRLSPRAGFAIAVVGFVAVALWNVSVFRSYVDYPKVVEGTRVFSIGHKSAGIAGDILHRIDEEVREHPGQFGDANIFVAFNSAVSEGTLNWMAAKHGMGHRFHGFDRNQQMEDYQSVLPTYKYVLTAEEGVPEMAMFLPTVSLHGLVHEMVAADPGFIPVAEFPTYTGKSIFLFRRK